MLPDYPKIKTEIQEQLELFFRKKVEEYAYPIKDIPKSKIFEGRKSSIIRPSGKKDELKMMEAKTIMEIKYDEVGKLLIIEVLERIDAAALDFAKQMVDGFYKTISEICEEKGQTIDHKGIPLSPEIILQAFEKVFISFDQKGNPELPKFHIGPELAESMENAMTELHTDPSLRRKFEELIAKKRENWRAEQAARKLVG